MCGKGKLLGATQGMPTGKKMERAHSAPKRVFEGTLISLKYNCVMRLLWKSACCGARHGMLIKETEGQQGMESIVVETMLPKMI